MTAPTHEKKNLTDDFSNYPSWAVSKPVTIDVSKLNVTAHTPWKKPPEDEPDVPSNGREKARERYVKRYLPKL